MRKMIKVESGSFAALVRSYKKSLNMLPCCNISARITV
jgi:hypothetical protein